MKSLVTSLVTWWRERPKVRAGVRQVATLVASYVFTALVYGGFTDLKTFLTALGIAVATSVAGLLGLEPFVGLKAKVVVPQEQAVDSKASL